MNKKEAKILMEPFKGYKKFQYYFMDERARAYGAYMYLEAIKKAGVLEEALIRIASMGLDPNLGQIVGSEHYEKAWLDSIEIAEESIKQYRKIK